MGLLCQPYKALRVEAKRGRGEEEEEEDGSKKAPKQPMCWSLVAALGGERGRKREGGDFGTKLEQPAVANLFQNMIYAPRYIHC